MSTSLEARLGHALAPARERWIGPRPRAWAHALPRRPGRWLAFATLALLMGLLSACAQVPLREDQPPAALIHDDLFPPAQEVIDADRILAPSAGMRTFIAQRLTHGLRGREPRDVLVDALGAPGQLRLEYDAEMTRTAGEAFDARMGNCLSLTLMTASFARELGIPVTFRQIYQEEQVSRVADLQVVSGHVNIGLGRRPTEFPRPRRPGDDDRHRLPARCPDPPTARDGAG